MRCISLALSLALLSGCTANLPDIDDTISPAAQAADYPELQPLPDLLAQVRAGSTIEVQTEALQARVARLQARARALKGRSIIDGATRLKLLEATRGKPA